MMDSEFEQKEHTGIQGVGGLRAVKIPERFGGGIKMLQDGEQFFTIPVLRLIEETEGKFVRFESWRLQVLRDRSPSEWSWKAIPRDYRYVDMTEEEYERWAAAVQSDREAIERLNELIRQPT